MRPTPRQDGTSDLDRDLARFDLRRNGPDPLHVQIEQAIRDRIVTGRWPAHRQLPPEPECATLLGVNRGTFRRALAALIAQGLVIAHRGRGTFVAPTAGDASIAQRFRSLSEDFAAQGFTFTRHVRSLTAGRLPLPVRAVLGASPSTPGMRLERVFEAAQGPLAYLVNYVRTDGCPSLVDVDFTRVSLFDALTTTFGVRIDHGRRTISAQAASGEVASALGVPPGTAVLYLEQVSFTEGGTAIEYSDVWIDSAKVTITSMLQRD